MGGKGSGKKEPPRKRHQQTGLLGVVLATEIPARVIGVAQHGGPEMPVRCLKCHAGAPMYAVAEWEAHCMCGFDYFRTRGEVKFAHTVLRAPEYATPAGDE